MTKWEYQYVYFESPEDGDGEKLIPVSVNGQKVQRSQGKTLHEYSNWLGQEGWEIVGTLSGTFDIGTIIFKRPLP